MPKKINLSKIKAKYILDNIFDFINDEYFIYKLFKYSKSYHNKLNLKLYDYQEKYLEKISLNIPDYFSI